MSDEPKDSLSTEYILKEVHDKEKKEILSNVVYGIRQRSGLLQYRQQILLL